MVSLWRLIVNTRRALNSTMENIKPNKPRKICSRNTCRFFASSINGRTSEGRYAEITREKPGKCIRALFFSGNSRHNVAASATRQNGTDHAKSYHAISGASDASNARLAIHVEPANTPMAIATGKYKRQM